jgi:hypothetical protein
MYAVAFILVPRERVSEEILCEVYSGLKPYSLLAGGQQINVLRRRAPNPRELSVGRADPQ